MRTAVYVRVSTQRQSQAQTIDQQLACLRARGMAKKSAKYQFSSFKLLIYQ